MKKKITLGLSSLTAIVAPVATLVSCDFGSSKKDDGTTKGGSTGSTGSGNNNGSTGSTGSGNNNGSTGSTGSTTGSSMELSSVKDSQKSPLQTADLNANPKWTKDEIFKSQQFHGKVTTAAADAVDAIIAKMNAEQNWAWHTIGDSVLDGINAVRYVIMKDAQGDKTLKTHLATFITEVFNNNSFRAKANPTTADKFFNDATLDINGWLDIFGTPHTYDFLHLANGMTHGVDYKTTPIHSKEELSKMNPMRLSVDMMVRSEYRAQQIEWRGPFDGHQWKATNQEIVAKQGETTAIHDGILAPKPMDLNNIYGGENYVFYFEATADSDPRAVTAGFKNNIYEGFMDAVGVLYDNLDGSQTTGHRQNFYTPFNQTFGYSLTLSDGINKTPSPFLITSNDGSGMLPEVNASTISKQVADFSWTKTVFGWTDAHLNKFAMLNPTMTLTDLYKAIISPYMKPSLWFTPDQLKNIMPLIVEATKATKIDDFLFKVSKAATTPTPSGSYIPANAIYASGQTPSITDHKVIDSLLESNTSQFVEHGVTGTVSGIYDILGGSVAGIKMEPTAKVSDAEFNKLFGL